MNTVILIMVILSGDGAHRTGASSVFAEFDSLESCRKAVSSLSEQVRADRGSMSRVIAAGCYYK